MAWVEWNVRLSLKHKLTCTGTTSKLLEKTIRDKIVHKNIPIACNRSTEDFMISSPLMKQEYDPILKDYEERLQRDLA